MFHSALILYFVHLVLVPTDAVDQSANQTIRKHPIKHRVKRIKDSEETTLEKYPCLVSATKRDSEYDDTQFSIVTGVLITPEWFLSDKFMTEFQIGHNGEGWKITGGNKKSLPAKGSTMSDYSRMIFYDKDDNSLDYDGLVLVQFTPPLKTGTLIQPAKLPPDPHFSSKCEDVTVVGWGTGNSMGPGKTETRTLLSQTEAKVIKCEGKVRKFGSITLNIFCLSLSNLIFTVLDRGLPVFCKNDTLIGILQTPYEGDDSKTAFATNISQYMTWLKNTTGVKVAYESEPIYELTAATTVDTVQTKEKTKSERSLTFTEANVTDTSSGNNLKADLWCIFIGIAVVLFRTI